MFKNLTYEKKNKWLIVVAVVLALLIYSLFIKKTIASVNECSDLNRKMALATNAPAEIERIQNELVTLNSIIGSDKRSEIPVREDLLGFLTSYCQSSGIVLREFPQTEIKKDNDLQVETNTFTVEGHYVKLLQLVYQLEQKKKIGNVSSVIYQAKKDNTTKRLILTVTIYLQNIKKQVS
jgi:hypothetical protein